MVKEFIESAYKFSFADGWNVIKYDEHRFYKTISGQSMSGVDFAGIIDGGASYLIEVKNYKQHKPRVPEKTIEEFEAEMIEKARDSLQLISVIQKYLKKKFWYRAFYGLVRKYPSINREWFFWSELAEITLTNKNGNFVLLIDSHFSIDTVQKTLIENFKDDFKTVKVISLRDKKEIQKLNIDVSRLFQAL